FIASGPAALIIGYGLLIFLRRQREKILGFWLLSLVVFYLLWFGFAATNQSYYNLPALAPLCALFGIGMRELFSSQYFIRWGRAATIWAPLLVILHTIPVCPCLFSTD